MKRRNFLRTGVGIAGTVGLAGCLGGNKTQSQPTNTSETRSSDENSRAGRANQQRALRQSATVVLPHDITRQSMDVFGGVSPNLTRILEPLLWVNDNMAPVPWLATDWKATGKKTWEFTLREGVTFHNGKPLNADAVVFSFKELLNELSYAPGWLHLKPDGVRKIDDMTVEFENTTPYPPFPGTIATAFAAIQHPDRSQKQGEVIGTGPFQVTDVKQQQYVQTEAFDDYWNEKPLLSKLRFRVIMDPNTRALALKGGEADVAFSPPSSRVPSLEKSESTRIEMQLAPAAGFAGFNLYKSPTDDVKLRQGMNWAISQQVLVNKVLNGVGFPAKSPISKVIPWSAHEKLPAYGPDLTKAKQLIEASSYDGENLKLLVGNWHADHRLIAQVLRQMLDNVGINVEIRMLGAAAFGKASRHGKGHIFVEEMESTSAASDYLIHGMFHSKGSINDYCYKKYGTGILNLGGRVDELIEKGSQTGDPAVKERVYEKALQIVMQKGVVAPLYYGEYVVGARADIGGLELPEIKSLIRWNDLRHANME